MSQSRLLVSLILLILFLLPLDSAEAQQNPGVEYLRYNVDITLEESGDFRVRETQKVWYGGEFSEGFAEIPLDYLNDITDITVYGGLDEDNLSPYEFDGYGPDTFSLEKEGDTLYVDWEYEPTSWGDELTFEIEYVVDGGLWIYPDADYLEWRAVPADRSGLEIPESQITINLPFSQGQEDVVFEAIGPEFSAVSRTQDDGQQIIFTADEPLPDGIAFQIMVEFPHGLIGAAPQTWQITEDEAELVYRIPSIDIEMSLDEAGNLHISEHQNVQVVEGMMYEGFRRFTWLFLEGLDKLYVYEGDVYYDFVDGVEPLVCEDCFTLSMDNRYSTWVTYDRTNDEIDINDYAAGSGEVTWRFPPLVKGEETIFDLEYDAFGTVSINEEDQKLHWTVLPGYDVPVEIATVHLSLPNRLGLEDVTIEGANSAQSANGEILLTLDAPATDWAIQVTMPPGTTSADKPSWQLEFEGVYAEAEAYRQRLAREKVMFGAGGLAVLVIGLLGGLAAWYLRGSQKWREMRGNYRTIPPSDLAPGLVAYLIDEKATAKGALASLLHLATLGLVRLELGNTLQLERISKEDRLSENEKLKSPAGQTIQVEPHIVFLYNSLVGVLPLNSPVTFDSLLDSLKTVLPGLYTKMGEDLVVRYHKHGSFQSSSKLPKRAFFVSLLLFLGVFIVLGPIWKRIFVTPLPSAPIIIGMVLIIFASLTWWIVGSQRQRSLSKAAELEAKHWIGFKAYLQEIQQYGDLLEAQEILDRYFDYAVALDVDERLLQQVKTMGATVPIWLGRTALDDGTTWQGRTTMVRPGYVRPWYRRGSWTGRKSVSQKVPTNVVGMAINVTRPPLQRLSGDLNGSLSNASQSLTRILNTTVGAGSDPVKVNINAFGKNTELEWSPDTPIDKVIGDIMSKSQTIRPPRPSRSSGGGFRGGSSRSSSRSRSGGRSRSSSSRRSGGGGRRGFR